MELPSTFKRLEELDDVRAKFFTHRFRKGYQVFDGFTLPEFYKDFREEIENFEVYDDDVWVTCFPKTGGTWSREMVWIIANNLDLEGAKLPLPYRFPLLEFCAVFDFTRHAEEKEDFVEFPAICDSIKLVREAKRPRFIHTHLPWNLLPRQIRNFNKTPKIIHIARNAKDTCVSYFHHCKIMEGYTGNFEDFWQLFITNKLNYTSFWNNVLSYWNKRDHHNVLFITYEDMKKDLKTVVLAVAKFFNKVFSEQEIQKMVEHLNYESMRKAKAEQFEPLIELLKQLDLCQNESGDFKRAGLIGNYRAQMCADVIDIYDRWTKECTAGTGLHFDISKFIKK